MCSCSTASSWIHAQTLLKWLFSEWLFLANIISMPLFQVAVNSFSWLCNIPSMTCASTHSHWTDQYKNGNQVFKLSFAGVTAHTASLKGQINFPTNPFLKNGKKGIWQVWIVFPSGKWPICKLDGVSYFAVCSKSHIPKSNLHWIHHLSRKKPPESVESFNQSI